MGEVSKLKRTGILNHWKAFNSKCENIKWLLGSLVAQFVVINTPDIIETSRLPVEVCVDGLRLPAAKIFGLGFTPSDRRILSRELLAAARRLLIADSTEQLIESVCRAWGMHEDPSGTDPYEKNKEISFTCSRIYGNTRAGSLLTKEERAFIKEVACPIRNAIRHNNGVISPGSRPFTFSGKVAGREISVKLERGKPLKLSLEKSYSFFEVIKTIGNNAFTRLFKEYAA